MKRSVLAMVLIAATPFAQAAELSYSYFEAGYFNVNPKHSGNMDGWALRGSAAVSDNFHVFGGFDHVGAGSIDIDAWRLGVGYNHNVFKGGDLVARVAYEGAEDLNGWSTEVGLRGALGSHFEGLVGLGYSKTSGYSGDYYLFLESQIKINSNWGLVAEGRVFEDGHILFIGPRMTY